MEVSEYQECLMLFNWAKYQPLIGQYLIHHANEGKRSPRYGARLRAIGLRAGLPDYQLPIANEKWHGLWIEMKRKNCKVKRLNQYKWIEKLLVLGQYATYAHGWEEAVKIIMDYLNNEI